MMGTTNYLALVGGGKSPKFAMNKVYSFTLEYHYKRVTDSVYI
jgi:hypothetical protein